MTALLVLLALADQSLATGDAWTIERSYRFLKPETGIDFTHVERTDYKVVKPGTIDATWSLTATKFGDDVVPSPKENTPRTARLTFNAAGVPTSAEDTVDRLRARVERIQWCAAEPRQGVSWTRKIPLSPALPAAKVTVRPTSQDRRTLAVTYLEDGGVKGEATVTLAPDKAIVASLKLTFVGLTPPGGNEIVSIAVNQSLVKDKKA